MPWPSKSYDRIAVMQQPWGSLIYSTGPGSDRVIVVPPKIRWRVILIRVTYTSSATAGERDVYLTYLDPEGTSIVDFYTRTAKQSAGTTITYTFYVGAPVDVDPKDDQVTSPIPIDFYQGEGSGLRIYDKAAIDAAGDSMDIILGVQASKFITPDDVFEGNPPEFGPYPGGAQSAMMETPDAENLVRTAQSIVAPGGRAAREQSGLRHEHRPLPGRGRKSPRRTG